MTQKTKEHPVTGTLKPSDISLSAVIMAHARRQKKESLTGGKK